MPLSEKTPGVATAHAGDLSDLLHTISRARVAVLASCLLAAVNIYRFRGWAHSLDDSWISFRIARNWLESGALSYDLTRPPVEGMTNLSWTLLSAVWIGLWPQVEPAAVARCLGAVFHIATVAVLARLAAREAGLLGGRPGLAAWVTGCLVASSSSLAYHAVSGLETGLWGLVFAGVIDRYCAALRGDGRAAGVCGGLLGLLVLTRPEAVVVGGILCMVLVGRRRAQVWKARVIAPFLVTLAVLVLFRWFSYGELLPNTFHAKPPTTTDGLAYLKSFVLYGLGVIGPLAAIPAMQRSFSARILALVGVTMLAGSVWSGGDWMPGFRRFTIPTLCFFTLAGVGLAVARQRWRAVALASLAIVISAHLVGQGNLGFSYFNTSVFAELGKLARQTPEIQQVALTDIGRFGWEFRRSIFDLAGLTDHHIARLPGTNGRKAWDEAYFRARNPDLVLLLATNLKTSAIDDDFSLRSFDEPAFSSMLTAGGYRFHTWVPYLKDTKLLIFARDGLMLPSETWGPPAERDLLAEARSYRGLGHTRE